jgi:hypothetical protein
MTPDAVLAGLEVALDVYGFRARLRSDWIEVLDQVRRDFAWFEAAGDGAAAVEVIIERRAPQYGEFDGLEASFVTPRNTVYQRDGQSIIDYFGAALSVLDRRSGTLRVEGEYPHLVHEACYLFLLSRIGEHLDSIGLPRLHALGLSGSQGGVALILPSGGGKSTLALRALRDDRVKLLSEDSPLIDRRGRLHPFPLRLGINPHQVAELPPGNVRRLERMEFDPKLLLDLEAFADRIEHLPQPLRHLVIGRRSLGAEAKLQRVARRAAVGPLLRESVVGVGLYQGMEFILQRGMVDTLRKARPVLVRSAACAASLSRAAVWQLTLGRENELNWEALAELLL